MLANLPPLRFRGRRLAALLIAAALALPCGVAGAQETAAEAPAPETPAETAEAALAPDAPAAAPEDVAAQAYATKCMGCHTIGGGALSGPDLKPSAAWPRKNLWDAIKRMEKNVGPMADEEIDLHTDFLLAVDAAERIAEAQKQAALRHAATMEPASADTGRALFLGRTPFANGGLACGACHQAGGRGGSLASSLEDAFTRLGEAPLMAACESPGYPVMRAMYLDSAQPVTRQEALHVVKYLEQVSGQPQSAISIPLHLLGVLGAGGTVVLLATRYKKTPGGTRARLVARACRKQDTGQDQGV
ncbi:MAG: c-type cytochrome [Candidatus Hydrogenedentes bacterium]|nr:c-type cytochrome [Candidatus Hydrogenedentota bacterium]